jgi:TonB family protein
MTRGPNLHRRDAALPRFGGRRRARPRRDPPPLARRQPVPRPRWAAPPGRAREWGWPLGLGASAVVHLLVLLLLLFGLPGGREAPRPQDAPSFDIVWEEQGERARSEADPTQGREEAPPVPAPALPPQPAPPGPLAAAPPSPDPPAPAQPPAPPAPPAPAVPQVQAPQPPAPPAPPVPQPPVAERPPAPPVPQPPAAERPPEPPAAPPRVAEAPPVPRPPVAPPRLPDPVPTPQPSPPELEAPPSFELVLPPPTELRLPERFALPLPPPPAPQPPRQQQAQPPAQPPRQAQPPSRPNLPGLWLPDGIQLGQPAVPQRQGRPDARPGLDTSVAPRFQDARPQTSADLRVTGAQVGADWEARFRRWLYQRWFYPLDAAARGEDGVTRVLVRVAPDGTVRSVTLVGPSTSPTLNRTTTGVFIGAQVPALPADRITDPDNIVLDFTLRYILTR